MSGLCVQIKKKLNQQARDPAQLASTMAALGELGLSELGSGGFLLLALAVLAGVCYVAVWLSPAARRGTDGAIALPRWPRVVRALALVRGRALRMAGMPVAEAVCRALLFCLPPGCVQSVCSPCVCTGCVQTAC